MTIDNAPTTDYPAFLQALAEKLHTTAGTETVFGEPRDAQGRTVIPVARVAYGLGGGYGKAGGNDASERPSSGGGGIAIKPVGYIEVTAAATRFIPIRSGRAGLVASLLASLAAAVLLAVTRRK